MDIWTFTAKMTESLALPITCLIGFIAALIVFGRPLRMVLKSLKHVRYGDFEAEIVQVEDAGNQEIIKIAEYLRPSAHSFDWFREKTEFNYSNEEFSRLINKYPKILENIKIVSGDAEKRETTPAKPGMRLTSEAKRATESIILGLTSKSSASN